MVGTHTRALAFVTLCFLARSRADLLRAIRLDNIDLAVTPQRPIDEIVEPGLWHLPIGVCPADPFRCRPPAVLQPLPIVIGKRQSNPKFLTTSGPTQNDRNWLLIPDIVETEPVLRYLQIDDEALLLPCSAVASAASFKLNWQCVAL